MFDAIAAGDYRRLDELCTEHRDLIVQRLDEWADVPTRFLVRPELEAWYRKGLRAISAYCAERFSKPGLVDQPTVTNL